MPVASSRLLTYQGTKVGYIALSQFAQGAGAEVRSQVQLMLHRGAQSLILDLRRQGVIPAGGRVMEVGAQQLLNQVLIDTKLRDALATEFQVSGSAAWWSGAAQSNLMENGLSARTLWQWLSFDYMTIDIDNTPDSIPLDLNYDDVPSELRLSFDLVTNLGTTEHVANQLNAFKVIHDLTRVGGVMFHDVPAQGYTNHGLVNYTAKFVFMLCRSNKYKLLYLAYAREETPRPFTDQGIMDFIRTFGDKAVQPIENVELHAGFSEADESGGAMRNRIEKFAVLRETGAQFEIGDRLFAGAIEHVCGAVGADFGDSDGGAVVQ